MKFHIQKWLFYTLTTTLFWGVWGAFIEIPEKNGFPATLGYVVWAITMVIPALVVLKKIKWKIDIQAKSIFYGLSIGLLGAGGQFMLFTNALTRGPAYLIFPIISLSPLVTIILSYIFLKERTNKRGWWGIVLAIIAIPLLAYQSKENTAVNDYAWLIAALIVFTAWGLQAYIMKFANTTMKAESIFFYMTITGIMLIPLAISMTNFSQSINFELSGFYLCGGIQILNSIGALCIVYAFRYGKAIIVSPMTNAAAPILTVILSLIMYRQFPHYIVISGIIAAILATFLMAITNNNE